ncbi:MAG TPA: ribonuclease P protein component [bacterium]|nr:ribonuclease P protein component [bacterium]
MLKKNNRLTKKKDFDRLFQLEQAKYYGNVLGVRIAKNQLKYNRFGIIISKKLCRLAVGRNRVRRQISSLIRQDLDKLQPGFDVVILIIDKQTKNNRQFFQKELQEAWKRLKIIV